MSAFETPDRRASMSANGPKRTWAVLVYIPARKLRSKVVDGSSRESPPSDVPHDLAQDHLDMERGVDHTDRHIMFD